MPIVNVFVVDVTTAGYPTGTNYVPNRPDVVTVQVGDRRWQPSDIAYEILAKVSERGVTTRIGKLHLASHGNSGELFMGSGMDIHNVNGLSILAGHLVEAGAFSIAPQILLAQVDWIVGGEGHKAEKNPCSNPPHTCPFLHLSNQNAVHSVVSDSAVRNSSR